MASRALSRQYVLRDWPLAKVVLVWITFAFSVFFYFSDWPAPRHTPAPTAFNVVSKEDAAEIYTGSILIARPDNEYCWERQFDNRTGTMWNKGLVTCRKAPSREKEERMRALRTFFNR